MAEARPPDARRRDLSQRSGRLSILDVVPFPGLWVPVELPASGRSVGPHPANGVLASRDLRERVSNRMRRRGFVAPAPRGDLVPGLVVLPNAADLRAGRLAGLARQPLQQPGFVVVPLADRTSRRRPVLEALPALEFACFADLHKAALVGRRVAKPLAPDLPQKARPVGLPIAAVAGRRMAKPPARQRPVCARGARIGIPHRHLGELAVRGVRLSVPVIAPTRNFPSDSEGATVALAGGHLGELAVRDIGQRELAQSVLGPAHQATVRAHPAPGSHRCRHVGKCSGRRVRPVGQTPFVPAGELPAVAQPAHRRSREHLGETPDRRAGAAEAVPTPAHRRSVVAHAAHFDFLPDAVMAKPRAVAQRNVDEPVRRAERPGDLIASDAVVSPAHQPPVVADPAGEIPAGV